MKKTLIAFAALTAIAGIAQAQSTVTIYGILDANIGSYKSNAVVGSTIQNLKQNKIESDGLNGSRWGIRLNEDLGGGLAAVGNLESGFDISTGGLSQGNGGTAPLFGRRANVGVSSTGFGTVTLGRNSSSYDDVSADHAMMGQSTFDPSNVNNGFNINANNGVNQSTAASAAALMNHGGRSWIGYNTRFNNSIKYISPNFSGFSGSLMYALGEDKTPTNNASKSVSANLKYANGPLLVSGGYQSEAAGGGLTGTTTLVATNATPALENTLLSVAYDLGVAKIGAGFNRAKFKDVIVPTYLGGNGSATFAAQKEYNLSVAVPLGATTLSAGYAQSKGDTLGKSSGFGVQALYSLSKRTTLYVGGTSVKVYDKVATSAAVAFPGSSIGKTTIFAAGVRHTF